MNLNFSEEDQKFKTEVRSFIQENLNKETAKRVEEGLSISKESTQEWQKKLASKGWLAPGWPKEYGGTGWSLTQRYIFDEECGVASTPRTIPFGVTMVGPVIIKYGTEEQKKKYLPKILSSDEWWCQGYSEPGSGSARGRRRPRRKRSPGRRPAPRSAATRRPGPRRRRPQ